MIRKFLVFLVSATAIAAGAANAQDAARQVAQADRNSAATEATTDPQQNGTARRGEAKGAIVSDNQRPVSAAEMIGTPVMSADQQEIGTIGDVVLGAKEETIKAYLVDIGGFLGLNTRRVAFAADSLEIYKDESGTLHIYSSVTDEVLDATPDYDEQVFRVNPDSLMVQEGRSETDETLQE